MLSVLLFAASERLIGPDSEQLADAAGDIVQLRSKLAEAEASLDALMLTKAPGWCWCCRRDLGIGVMCSRPGGGPCFALLMVAAARVCCFIACCLCCCSA